MSQPVSDFLLAEENIWMLQIFAVVLLTAAVNLGVRWLLHKFENQAKRSRSIWDDAALAAAGPPLRVLVWVAGLNIASVIIADHTGSAVFRYASEFRALAFVVLLAWFLVRFVHIVEEEMLSGNNTRRKVDPTSTRAIAKLTRISVIITATLILMERLGYSVSGVMAFGGIGGIAVGFAARDMLSNFFGGLMLFLDRPFSIGDWVRSPDKTIEGIVEQIGWRQTRIRSFDKRPLYIPNSTFSSITVENPSRMNYRCIKETLSLRHEDREKLPAILEKINAMLGEHAGLAKDEPPSASLDKVGGYSIDIALAVYTPMCSYADYIQIKQSILLQILKIIEDEGAAPFVPPIPPHS